MKNLCLNIRLLIVFVVLLAGTLISVRFFLHSKPLEYSSVMKESAKLAARWIEDIGQMKLERGIVSDAHSNVRYNWMIGNEWSEITTTLGSLDAKETSTNPVFSALIVRLLNEAGIDKDDKAGVIISGSFPSLGISTLAALQVMGIDAVVMSSVGASTYGANQPGATWLDIERFLNEKSGLKYQSELVSIGAGGDSGDGLSAEGISLIRNTAKMNNVVLYTPVTLTESIEKRFSILQQEHISILISIGGNQTSLGNCGHSTGIPNGLVRNVTVCNDKDRGLIIRMTALGIPVINLLDIKELASRYGLEVSPGTDYKPSDELFSKIRADKPILLVVLILCLIPVLLLKRTV